MFIHKTLLETLVPLSPQIPQESASFLTQCQEIRDEVVFGQKLPQTCGFQETQPIICCPKLRQPGYISIKKCREYASYTKENQLCGHKIVKRIIGGKPAGRTEFPHMALLGYQKGDSKIIHWLCGGSLISEEYILTAAHCLSAKEYGEPKLVLLGITNLGDTNHRQEIKVVNSVHPENRNASNYHDIALVKLEKPIEMSLYVRPACLKTNFEIPVSKAIATGWGRTEDPTKVRSEDLLKVTLDIVDHQFCNALYGFVNNDIHVCTGRGIEKKDTCRGDAGGPVQVYHNNDATLCMYDIVGVVSIGGPCNKGGPSVNTRVSYYIKWIEDTVWPESSE